MATAVEKDAIREVVLAEYCFRRHGGQFAAMAALFIEDSIWETAFGKTRAAPPSPDLARGLREGGPHRRAAST